jgi:hypothetical protein
MMEVLLEARLEKEEGLMGYNSFTVVIILEFLVIWWLIKYPYKCQ